MVNISREINLARKLLSSIKWKEIKINKLDKRAQRFLPLRSMEDYTFYEFSDEDTKLVAYKAESSKGDIIGIAFSGSAKKAIFYNSFRNESRLDAVLSNALNNLQKKLERKRERLKERKQFKHDYKEGSILYSSWGYDQTNVNFYEVIDTTAKTISVKEIKQKVISDKGPSVSVVGLPGKFIDSKVYKRRVQPNGSIKIDSSERAYLWDGSPLHQTGFGYGH